MLQIVLHTSKGCSIESRIRSLFGSSTHHHNRVIIYEVPRDFHVTVVVKQSPIHWFGSLTRYVEDD